MFLLWFLHGFFHRIPTEISLIISPLIIFQQAFPQKILLWFLQGFSKNLSRNGSCGSSTDSLMNSSKDSFGNTLRNYWWDFCRYSWKNSFSNFCCEATMGFSRYSSRDIFSTDSFRKSFRNLPNFLLSVHIGDYLDFLGRLARISPRLLLGFLQAFLVEIIQDMFSGLPVQNLKGILQNLLEDCQEHWL